MKRSYLEQKAASRARFCRWLLCWDSRRYDGSSISSRCGDWPLWRRFLNIFRSPPCTKLSSMPVNRAEIRQKSTNYTGHSCSSISRVWCWKRHGSDSQGMPWTSKLYTVTKHELSHLFKLHFWIGVIENHGSVNILHRNN